MLKQLINSILVFGRVAPRPTWVITNLKNALEISRWTEADHKAIEYLATLAPAFPALAVDCLTTMVEGDKEGWGIRYWSIHARTILGIALSNASIENESRPQQAAGYQKRLSCSR
jgi:hypothetical protein